MAIKIKEAMYLVIFSILDTSVKTRPALAALKAMTTEKMITGKPVPRAKSGARNKPSLDFNIRGIKTPKNRTPLYGQNAKANNIPSNSEPR